LQKNLGRISIDSEGKQGKTDLPARAEHSPNEQGGEIMLSWALGFFIVAIIAAIFGFTGIAAGAANIAQFLFWLFVILFVISLVVGLVRRPRV
jgi:uncharacterized membrane protein YtjA (UPF0391 family)